MNHLVLFDVDGTLCDTCEVDGECFWGAAQEFLPIPVGGPDWEDFPLVTDSGIADELWRRHLGRAPTIDEVEGFAGAFLGRLQAALTESPERFRAIRGAANLFDALSNTASTRFAFATGGWSRSAKLKLRAAGLPVERLLASADDSMHRTEIFRLARERALSSLAPSTPTRTILIGDGTWDVAVAAELGWSFIGIAQGQREAELRAAGATVVVPDYADLERVTAALI